MRHGLEHALPAHQGLDFVRGKGPQQKRKIECVGRTSTVDVWGSRRQPTTVCNSFRAIVLSLKKSE